eukprot:RCo006876
MGSGSSSHSKSSDGFSGVAAGCGPCAAQPLAMYTTPVEAPETYLSRKHVPEFLQAVTQELRLSQPDDPFPLIQARAEAKAMLHRRDKATGCTAAAWGLPSSPYPASVGRIPPLSVVILAVDPAGDIQPYVALGLGLQKRGHRVRLACHNSHRQLVAERGMEHFPLIGDPSEMRRQWSEPQDTCPAALGCAASSSYAAYHSAYLACTVSSGSEPYVPDVILSTPAVEAHIHIAERLQIPLQIVSTLPWAPTTEFPHPLASPWAARLYGNKDTFAVVSDLRWEASRSDINRLRTEILGLPLCADGASLIVETRVPQIYCMAPCPMPKPKDWGPHIDMVGFWFLEQSSGFDSRIKAPELVQFLESGPPPLYVGFGTMVVEDSQGLTRRVIDGVAKSGVRAILDQGWAKLGEGVAVGEKVFVLKHPVPLDWLFPQCGAVCHHGDSGVVAAGLRAGEPTLVITFSVGQVFLGCMRPDFPNASKILAAKGA